MNEKSKKPSRAKRMATADGFANLTARLGRGADNLISRSQYLPDNLSKNRVTLEWMHRTNWICGMAVDTVAEDMCRAGINIKGEVSPANIAALQREMINQGIWRSLRDTLRWARLYGGALAVIEIDGQDSKEPLRIDTVATKQFTGLTVYDRWQTVPDLQHLVQTGVDAGLPEYYGITADSTNAPSTTRTIHHSRAIRMIGLQLPHWQAVSEMLWGASILERINDRLDAFNSATAGAANLIFKAHLRTVGIDKLREILAAGGKAQENLITMFDYMRLLQNNEGITLLDKQDNFQTHSYSFSGLSDMLLQFGEQISGALGIPLVRLFGQSPAGLSATGEADLRNYYDLLKAQQETMMRPGLLKILQVIHRSLFAANAPSDFDFDFVSLWQTSNKEKADIASIRATTVINAHAEGIIDTETAMLELRQLADDTGLFSNISPEKIAEAHDVPPPEPEAAAPDDAAPATAMETLANGPA